MGIRENFNVQGYVNIRKFAGVVEAFGSFGIKTNGNYSFVIKQLIDYMVEELPNCEEFESSEAAAEYLIGEGFSPAQFSDADSRRRRMKSLHEAIRVEKEKVADVVAPMEDMQRLAFKSQSPEGLESKDELDLLVESLRADAAAGKEQRRDPETDEWGPYGEEEIQAYYEEQLNKLIAAGRVPVTA